MKEITMKLVEEAKELKDFCIKAMTDESVFMDMDPEGIIAMQKMLKMFNTSVDYALEHAKMMDEMNEKLDKIAFLMEMKGS